MGRILIPKLSGIPVASTSQVIVSNYFNPPFNNTYRKIVGSSQIPFTDGDGTGVGTVEILNGSGYLYDFNKIILSPNATLRVTANTYVEFTYPSWAFGVINIAGDGYDITFYLDGYPNPNFNPSTNPNLIPTSGWSPRDMTITSSSSNKISIKKQNLSSGKIKLYKNPPPTTLPLSTPNLYVSGLSVIIPPEYTNYANPTFGNPLIRQNNTTWSNGASYGGFLLSSQNVWYLYVGIEQYSEEDGWQNQSLQVATNTASGASIPLTGWVNYNSGGILIEGTVVLSTTP